MDAERITSLERVGVLEHRRGAVGTGLIALVWIGLAVWRPTVTYHLAPFLVAGAWPFLLRRGPLRVANADALRAAAAAFAVAIACALVLMLADAMRGPTLWDQGHAMLEVVPLAFAGAATGYRFARCGVAAD
jgi:hypothetical protein